MTAKVTDLQKDTHVPSSKTGLTTDHGVFVSDTDNWLQIADDGPGPFTLEDQVGREKIHRFDHERIPERVVHARGAAAHGYFKVFDDRASKYTYASVLTDASRTTPVFARFSTVQGSRGSADTVRDVRGNWDIVGNDIPVFFIQDAIKFPDFVHAVKPEPHNEVPTGQSAHNNFWDFVGLQPECNRSHGYVGHVGPRIPRSYRMMQGFGVNTFTLMNAAGERFFVKFHWIPELGVHSFIAGQDPDFHRKDLHEAIENGAPPTKFEFDILDATKVGQRSGAAPAYRRDGLNKTVDEYFPETEQVAFCTSHLVPGIGISDDPLLQGRQFSYFDTQISRLGVNWEQIPINRPICPVMNHNRDGKQQHRIIKSNVNYWPNRESFAPPVPPSNGGYAEYPEKVTGLKQRVRGKKFQEHFKHAQLFFNSLTDYEKQHLMNAISFELDHCDDPRVVNTYAKVIEQIDYELASTVMSHTSPALSQVTLLRPKTPTIKSRRIAILVGDGFNSLETTAIRGALKAGGALSFLISTRRGEIQQADSGPALQADHHFEGMRSTMFDAVIVPSGKHGAALAQNGRVVHWIREAFGHCKTIGAIGEGVGVVGEALSLHEVMLIDVDNGSSTDVVCSYGVVTAAKYGVASAAAEVLSVVAGSDKGFISNFAFEVSKHRCYERELVGLTAKVAF
ncbi:catalase-like domain-containing protein [Mucidula mucida]|nr:catalase-like domain-containing protein [Mucidula mucida]